MGTPAIDAPDPIDKMAWWVNFAEDQRIRAQDAEADSDGWRKRALRAEYLLDALVNQAVAGDG